MFTVNLREFEINFSWLTSNRERVDDEFAANAQANGVNGVTDPGRYIRGHLNPYMFELRFSCVQRRDRHDRIRGAVDQKHRWPCYRHTGKFMPSCQHSREADNSGDLP